MKRLESYILYTLLLGTMIACNDALNIVQDYEYTVETLPLPKKLKQGKSMALEFSIIRNGNYAGTSFKFRYFQSEGEGRLTDGRGWTIPMNRFQAIDSDDFVLFYQSACEEQQQLDFVFENNFGRRMEYTITFAGERTEPEPEQEPEEIALH